MAQPVRAEARAAMRSSSSPPERVATCATTWAEFGPTSQMKKRLAWPKCSSMVVPLLLVNATSMLPPGG